MRIDTRPINLQAPRRSMLRSGKTPASEFEVQAYLWGELRSRGYWVRGEYSTHQGRSRFDLIVFEKRGNNYFPLRIIETKCGRRRPTAGTSCGKQVDRYYDDFGVPVDVVGGWSEARKYLEQLESVLPASLATGRFEP